MGSLHHWFLVQQEEWLVSVQHFTGAGLADMISTKQDKPYSLVVSWLRTRLSYASLRAAVLCIRGSRSSHRHPMTLPLPLLRVRYLPQSNDIYQ